MKRVLVFDLGGGTFDVSVLQIEDGVIEVLATRGDTHLGGQDFDQYILNHCIADFKSKHEVDVRTNKRAMARLRISSEKAKRQLSTAHTSQIEIDSLAEDQDFELSLSRDKFE